MNALLQATLGLSRDQDLTTAIANTEQCLLQEKFPILFAKGIVLNLRANCALTTQRALVAEYFFC
jgi:hypothetical protein